MQELIERLDRWLQLNRPHYYAKLLPGLTEAELQAFETSVGVELPADFKLLYSWKNGQEGQRGRLVPNYDWLKAEWVLSSSHNTPKIEDEGFVTWTDEMWENDKRLNWITFLDNGSGNEYVLDLVGVYDGRPGQIVSFWNDDIGDDEIIHPSLYKWLETVVIALERGLFTGDEGDTNNLQEYDSYYALITENNPGYPIATYNSDLLEY